MATKHNLFMACILLLFMFETATAEDKISAQSFVIFNTKCAKCHEGGCSTRMCFEMDSSGAAVHIQNYAGNVSDKAVGELYSALQHMKKKCAYCASPAKVPADRKWSKDDIRLLSLTSRQGSFIPLGNLKAAKYTVQLAFEEPVEFRIEILSQYFEPLVDDYIFKPGNEMTLPFVVDEAAEHYLRIRSKMPLNIIGLSLNREARK